MYINLFLGAALLSLSSAAPVAKRDGCVPGTFNCFDGKTFAQCISGGTWSVTMSVSPGTTCQVGISTDPFHPDGDSSAPAPAPAPTPENPSPPPPPISNPPPPPTVSPTPISDNKGYPLISSWPSWETLKAKYTPIMGTSCESQGWGANNSPAETASIISAIESLHGTVDPRFLLSVIIQESSGCVRVITTNNGVRNPGLLQTNNGAHTCNEGGRILDPCPDDQINGMIQDGLTGGANNLAGNLAWAQSQGLGDSFAYAVAARKYNSGSVDLGNLDLAFGSTTYYVKNVMARVAGLAQ